MEARIGERTADQDADNPPPWDTRDIYTNFLKLALSKRTSVATMWVKDNLLSATQIAKLGAEQCVARLRSVKEAPSYLDKKQSIKIKAMIEQLEKRLDEHEVEGLLEKFRKLTPRQQTEFYQMLNMELRHNNR